MYSSFLLKTNSSWGLWHRLVFPPSKHSRMWSKICWLTKNVWYVATKDNARPCMYWKYQRATRARCCGILLPKKGTYYVQIDEDVAHSSLHATSYYKHHQRSRKTDKLLQVQNSQDDCKSILWHVKGCVSTVTCEKLYGRKNHNATKTRACIGSTFFFFFLLEPNQAAAMIH